MMKIYYILFAAFCLLFASCKPHVPSDAQEADVEMFPDYQDVTVPVNISPLNFRLKSELEEGVAVFKSVSLEETVAADGGCFSMSLSRWHKLAASAAGSSISAVVYFKAPNQSWKKKTFEIHVSPDSIDSYLTYRRIFPGYRMWNEMGIYQRCLENFEEKTLLTNKLTNNNCVNCHSFCANDGKKVLFHQRMYYAGTYVSNGEKLEKISYNKNGEEITLVYPYWHPSGEWIAFSTNETHQDFHFSDANRIEVYDVKSDVVLYNMKTKKVISPDIISAADKFETFPAFSPDGRKLIFCSADSVAMPERYKDVKYNLLEIDFNPETGALGNKIDTLYNAAANGCSVKFPRVSPNGKYLLFTTSAYGNFSIWHKDADLKMMDMESKEFLDIKMANSNDVESYHSWSSNSRWIVFSSRRLDGQFTRPFIAHVDENGMISKPFLLPQESAYYYDRSMFSFNIPELSFSESEPFKGF